MIKRHPEDFRVEEVLTREFASGVVQDSGAHTLYRLTKRGLGTDEALERIAAKLAVPPARIACAGLKDKHALTVQYVTITFPAGRGAIPPTVETPAWRLDLIGRLARGISAEDISGNRFRITVRNLTRRRCEAMTAARRLLSRPSAGGGRTLGFVNYYGEQRFGSARHGRGFAARRLIEGDFEGALRLLIASPDRKSSRGRKEIGRMIADRWGDWTELARTLPSDPERKVVERLLKTNGDFRAGFSALPRFIRQITVEAYQSWLWNEVARRVIVGLCPPPFIEVPSRFGGLVFPLAANVSRGLASTVIPLFSREAELREPWKSAAEGVLAEEGIAPEKLRVPGLRVPYFGEVSRPLFVEALGFSLGPVEQDAPASGGGHFMRRVRFFLPRGAYGTVLLGALGGAPQSSLR